MMAQLDPRQDSEARALPRTHLFLSATIRFDRVSAAIRLRDLSASGARVEGSILPAIGASAHIARGALNTSGTIVWRDRKGCGLQFDAPLPVGDWMPPRQYREQQAVDDMVEAVKSGSVARVATLPTAPTTAERLRDSLPQRLAEELKYVGRLLESLGEDLCLESLLVMRLGEKLQNLDIAAQILGHVATLLVADHPDQAVDSIGMASLRKRLLRTAL